MGCASSKEKICRNCQAPYSPVRRSLSLHSHHHDPIQKTGDSHHHSVFLTSSTLGSLRLDPFFHNHILDDIDEDTHNRTSIENTVEIENEEKAISKEEFALGVIEAKTWSEMIKDKIPKKIGPKTPIQTPPGEPETINVQEMMEGLEDVSPLLKPAHLFRSFSFQVPRNPSLLSNDDLLADSDSNSNSNDTSIASEFDPDVIAAFRRSLEELPPANPFRLKPALVPTNEIVPRGTEKLIVYFTSLRGVRKTYEDCCHVRVILKGLGVKVDERDVSMHSGFKDELKELLGEGYFGKGLGLPKVFLGRKCVGGADEIRRLNEDGKLEKMVERCELIEGGGDGDFGEGGNCKVCEACGDIRFVPCETCSGSCKIYYEEEDYDNDDEEESDESDERDEHEYGFHRCPDCNENGLIRCPICCD